MVKIASLLPKRITLISFALVWSFTVASASPLKPSIHISTRCGYGQAVTSDGTGCNTCAPGSYQPLISTLATACTPCSSLTYARNPRSRVCLACDFTTTPGSNACDPVSGQVNHCDPGWGLIVKFTLTPGCINCQRIPNTWSNGATRCLPCPIACPTSCALGSGACVTPAAKKRIGLKGIE